MKEKAIKQKISTKLVKEVGMKVLRAVAKKRVTLGEGTRYIETAAFYNGREQSVVLIIHGAYKPYAIVFGEHRNSDDIFVDAFEYDWGGLNPPTLTDFTKEAYRNREFFSYDQVEEAAAYVHVLIEQRMKENERAKTNGKAKAHSH